MKKGKSEYRISNRRILNVEGRYSIDFYLFKGLKAGRKGGWKAWRLESYKAEIIENK
jgi:hypothetical protein